MSSINPNLVVFQSWPDFADSPRALYDYITRNSEFETFWIVRSEEVRKSLSDKGIACALEGSDEANGMISQAQFLVSAAYELAMQKRLGQIFISTWHGFCLKLTGFFNTAVQSPSAFRAIRSLTTQFDAVTMTSQASRLMFAGMHACDPRKVFATGFPRNDYLFSENGRDHLRGILPSDVLEGKMILYLPTMRKSLKEEGAQFDDNIFNYPTFDSARIERLLEEHNAYLLVKFHPSDSALLEQIKKSLSSRIIYFDEEKLQDNQLTLYHVLNAFDSLITDYSSAYVDYLLLDRPMVFSCPDLARYEADRGFCVDDPTLLMPGAIVKTEDELLQSLDDILNGKDVYAPKRAEMTPFFHTHVDGNSSQRTFELMQRALEMLPPDVAKDYVDLYLDPNSPLRQYAESSGKVTGELYMDLGDGFNEKDKLVALYAKQSEPIEISFELPGNARQLRFDPIEAGDLALKGLEVTLDGRPLDYELPNGVEIDGIALFSDIDPQILLNSAGLDGKNLVIRFTMLNASRDDANRVDRMTLVIEELKRKGSGHQGGHASKAHRALRAAKKLARRDKKR